LNLTLEYRGEGEAHFRVPLREKLSGTGRGVAVHGGIITTLIDVTGAVAVRTLLEGDEGLVVTTDMHVMYMRPATSDVLATGQVLQIGSSMAYTKVSVRFQDGADTAREAARGQVTFRILEDASPESW
jgi:uncharacterized protein (TIGR00369 family)